MATIPDSPIHDSQCGLHRQLSRWIASLGRYSEFTSNDGFALAYRSESTAKYRVLFERRGLIVSSALAAARRPIIAEMIRSMNELWLYLSTTSIALQLALNSEEMTAPQCVHLSMLLWHC
jgi:hypothetical protein